jgi:hypothetical protein
MQVIVEKIRYTSCDFSCYKQNVTSTYRELDSRPRSSNSTHPSSGTQLASFGTPSVASKLLDDNLPTDATL